MPGDGKDFLKINSRGLELSQVQRNLQLEKTKDLSKISKDDPEKIKRAAQDFEALLLQQMLKSMWNTVPKDGMLSGSSEEDTYHDFLNEAVANEVAKGQGIGIKDVIVKDMQKLQKTHQK